MGLITKGMGAIMKLGKKSNKPKKESLFDYVDRKSAEDPDNLFKSPGKALKNIGKATAVGTTAVVGTGIVKKKLNKNKKDKK
jgi:hypothetical protein|tara:strand:+ start:212 stop:457 length:246 start_codon:yes stop_codon:yes gene_type:complete